MVSFSDDGGFGLVEVLVSAFITVLIAAAVLTGFNTASRASGSSKSQAIASNLAQRDQERLRALPITQLLPTPPQVAPPQVDGVPYTVESRSTALLNADGDVGCTSGGNGLIKVISTVRWPNMAPGRKPVRLATLVARPYVSTSLDTGSALLILRDADGNPVTGQSVNLTGPTTATRATDAEGCAYFPEVIPGSYAFTYQTSGWVDPDGVSAGRVEFSVAAQQLATHERSYDRAGYIPLPAIRSRVLAAPARGTFPSKAPQVRLVNGDTVRLFNTTSGPLGPLFPFPTDYALHTGSCAVHAGLTPADVTSIGTPYVQAVRVQRGATSPASLTLFHPTLDVRVTAFNGTVAVPGARVIFTPTDPECGDPIVGTTRTDGTLKLEGRTPPDDGDLGLPYGSYKICATYTTFYGLHGGVANTTVANTAVDGRKLSVEINSGGTRPGTCTG